VIPRAGRWHLIESTRSLSPFGIDPLKVVDHERNIFATATGLACLAALDNADVLRLVRELEGDLEWGLHAVEIDEQTLLQELEEIRSRGYAIRRKGYQARAESHSNNAIAVSINEGHRPIGSINVWWPRRHLSATRFARLHLNTFQSTADLISGSCETSLGRTYNRPMLAVSVLLSPDGVTAATTAFGPSRRKTMSAPMSAKR